MDSRKVIQRLRDDGWYLVNTEGSHYRFKHQTKKGRVTVPHPKKDLPVGTLKNFETQSGLQF
jgi:predicted RNA binding protein YcfA (HicA-like mRNA interferase family)